MRGPYRAFAFCGMLLFAMPIFGQVPHGPCSMNMDSRPSSDAVIRACSAVIKAGQVKGKDLAIAYFDRGMFYQLEGNDGRAISDYSHAIQLDPQYVQAYSNRGAARMHQRASVRALADYNRAAELAPENPGIYVNRGNAYRHSGDEVRAMADYDRAIQLNPKSALAYLNRGALLMHIGQPDAGKRDLAKAKQIDPNLVRAASRAIPEIGSYPPL